MTVKSWAVVAALMGALAFFVPAPASAAPVGQGLTTPAITAPSGLQNVNWRPYRHCHWRHGHRWCHGGYGFRRYYGGGPSFYFRFGRDRDRHHRRHWRKHRDRD